ncbi:uncharacterized protein [Miscanthus floridulus]|uniref:uncharacterized protein n=1 Tax=Miscanthus floridulus TaxID=154761 RepID=UPI0034593D9A
MLHGYNLALMNGAELFMREDVGLTDAEVEVLSGSMNVFMLASILAAGSVADHLGRRCTLVLANAFLMAGAPNLMVAAPAGPRSSGGGFLLPPCEPARSVGAAAGVGGSSGPISSGGGSLLPSPSTRAHQIQWSCGGRRWLTLPRGTGHQRPWGWIRPPMTWIGHQWRREHGSGHHHADLATSGCSGVP